MKINHLKKNVWKVFKTMQETLNFVSKQHDDTLTELRKIKEENVTLKKNQDLQQSTIKHLIDKCDNLEFKN